MAEITNETIRLASAGDRAAFALLYEAFAGMTLNVAFRIVGDMPLAEEVVQDVFLRVHRKLDQFSFRSSLKTWIYRIAVNTALNARSRTKREQEKQAGFLERAKQELMTTQPAPEPDSHPLDRVQEMLDLLSPEQRACIVLRSIEQLSYQEIADVLEININTVRTRLKRAREILLARQTEVRP